MGGKNGDICRLRASADRQATIPKIGLPPTNQLGRTSSKKCSAGALCSAWQWLCWQSPKLVSPCNAPQVCVAEEVNITRSHVVSAHHILCHSTLAHEHRLPSWPSGVKSLTTHPGMLPRHLLLLLRLQLLLLLLILLLQLSPLLLPQLQLAVRTGGLPLSSQVSIP